MTTPQFDELYKKLNPAQKKAVDTIEGTVMVVAGPGTGKTQVLTLRIANILLQTQVNPENILALTFTDSAVLSMRKRLVEIIGTPGYKVHITTFHSFCNDVIRLNPEDFSQLGVSRAIDEVDQIGLMEEILKNTKLILLKPFGDPLYHLKNVLSAINDLKKEGVTVDDYRTAIKDQQENFLKIDDLYYNKGAYTGQMKGKYQDMQKDTAKNEELLVLYEKYQQQLVKEKLFDFNDMLLQVITALEKDKNLLLRLQEKYQYILVDEHQDTNTAQNKLIELLCNFYSTPNLFVVGDQKQAIYRFQGASLENFLFFKKLYPEAQIINLNENYRSTQKILDAAGSLITKNITSEILEDKSLLKSNAKYKEELIKIVPLSDYQAEFYYLADDIKRKIEGGVTAREITVLVRNNRDLLPVIAVLEQKGIPYVMEADQSVLTDGDVRKLMLMLRAVANFDNDTDLINFCHVDFLKLPYLDLYRLIRFAKTSRSKVYEIMGDKKMLTKAGLEQSEMFIDFWKKLEEWKSLSVNENLQTVFVELIRQSGLLDWVLQKPNSLEILDKISGLYENIKIQLEKDPAIDLQGYLSYIDLLSEHDILIKKIPRTTLKDAVRLMTTHRSKGQEFDWVYILNVFDGHWGNQRKRSGGIKLPWESLGIKIDFNVELEANDDERRLFYVALTRAKQGVVITYSTRSLDGKEQVVSQFVEEIEESLKDVVMVEDFENDFLQHKEILFAPKIGDRPNLKDVEFFKQLFIERGISATALSNYLDCPWKFFYRNLLQLPDVKNKSMIFGTAVHKSISQFLKTMKFSNPTTEDVLSTFQHELLKELPEGVDLEELLDKGKKVLPGFFKERSGNWSAGSQSELFISGVNLTDQIKLTGMIDMIEPLGQGNEVVVYDFKTGRVRSRNEMEENYQQQLLFYKILLDRFMSGRMLMTKGVIEFVEPDIKGNYKQEIFEVTKDAVKALEDQIKFVADEIMTLAFWDRKCDDPKCEYCRLRELMLKA